MTEIEYDFYFAGINWKETFDLFPKLQKKIDYDFEFEDLKNENQTFLFFYLIWLCDLFGLWDLPELERTN